MPLDVNTAPISVELISQEELMLLDTFVVRVTGVPTLIEPALLLNVLTITSVPDVPITTLEVPTKILAGRLPLLMLAELKVGVVPEIVSIAPNTELFVYTKAHALPRGKA